MHEVCCSQIEVEVINTEGMDEYSLGAKQIGCTEIADAETLTPDKLIGQNTGSHVRH